MFGAIDASLLLEVAKNMGWMEQLEFSNFPPVVYIRPQLICDVMVGHSFNSSGWYGTEDHPGFAALRNDLEKRGYITTVRNCSNGDTVMKPFYLNQVYFVQGDRFFCAAAMKHRLRNSKYISSTDWYTKDHIEVEENHRCQYTMEMSF